MVSYLTNTIKTQIDLSNRLATAALTMGPDSVGVKDQSGNSGKEGGKDGEGEREGGSGGRGGRQNNNRGRGGRRGGE